MTPRFAMPPAFGKADLSNCEREQIQLAGSIQPHGALLTVQEPGYFVVQASANASAFLGISGTLIGRPLSEIDSGLLERIRPVLTESLRTIPRALRCKVGAKGKEFNALLHRPRGGGLVIELEQAGPPIDLTRDVERAILRILAAPSLRGLCNEAARIVKGLTGYDRVMLYRFDEDGHGQVFSEEREPELEPYLGNWYPASDIPQIARILYERNRMRMLADVEYKPVPLVPRYLAGTGEELDMSLCFLRSMSPMHIQYLKNMGVGATLVASLVVGGRLWGLIACHHYKVRSLQYELRAVCELLAETIATRIAALESFARAQHELSVRRLEDRMNEAISREGDWKSGLFATPEPLLTPLNATGAALLYENQIFSTGEVPGTHKLREIGRWLDGRAERVITTTSLGVDEPDFASLTPVASGLIAVPVSNYPGEYLIWFRPERIHTVTWGGNPYKPFIIGEDPSDLSPRRSFAKWQQLVEGTCEPWSPADLAMAAMIGETVSDIVLQFRSLRILIIKDQMEELTRQVRPSDDLLIIADSNGDIILANEAFQELSDAPRYKFGNIKEIAPLFSQPAEFRERLMDMLRNRRPIRGEFGLETGGSPKTLLLRADPVISPQGRVSGFVLMFVDVTERKAVESARRLLQEGIVQYREIRSRRFEDEAGLDHQKLLTALVENAQHAALEIADGVDVARVPEMLESVRSSVSRTAELLEHLILYAKEKSDEQ